MLPAAISGAAAYVSIQHNIYHAERVASEGQRILKFTIFVGFLAERK